jgi:hypothetical protein
MQGRRGQSEDPNGLLSLTARTAFQVFGQDAELPFGKKDANGEVKHASLPWLRSRHQRTRGNSGWSRCARKRTRYAHFEFFGF